LAGGEIQRLGEDGIVALDPWVLGGLRHRHERAERQRAGLLIDATNGRPEIVDVDQHLRPHHVELHQIEDRRAAGEKLCRRHRRGLAARAVAAAPHGASDVAGALIEKGAHRQLRISLLA
jgi:hypothetical protein